MYKSKEKLRLYRIWYCIKKRCCDEKNINYQYYGNRGITLCKEWLNFESFYQWAINNGYRNDLTIDRIDVNGNYEPSNCRWLDFLQQQYNKRKTIYYVYKGERKNLLELSKELDINKDCLKRRIQRGWDEKDLNKKSNKKNKELFEYKGQKIPLSEISKKENIPYKILYNRVKQLGWSLEKSLKEKKCCFSTKINLLDYNGEKMTITQIAKLNNLNRTTLQYRLKKTNNDLEKSLSKEFWRN